MNNDRFKFKVWEKSLKKFDEDDFYAPNSKGEFGYYNREGDFINCSHEVVPQQCTGLKDKKGVLIYEGDVLLDGDDDGYIGVVRWDDGCAQFIVWFDECDRESPICWDDLEIIGHILENPELLESK